jgi:hypothetical protein
MRVENEGTEPYKPPRYYMLLITAWETRTREPSTPDAWHFRLENPRTGQQRGFSSVEALLAAVAAEIVDGIEGTPR